MKPFEKLLENVEWTEYEHPSVSDTELYATHEGVMDMAGFKLRVYQLNNGQRVINSDDLEWLLS